MNLGTAEVIRTNSRHLPIADNSVDLVITSPPYFALRSYQDGGEHYAGQIGDEPTPDEFVSSLLEVTAECVRVLKPSGSLWVNLGDKYGGNGGMPAPNTPPKAGAKDYARPFQKQPAHGRPKSLIGIPWRYALRCIDDLGLILRAEVIWSKPNGLPESVTDRVRRSHEQWFHFTLNPRYFSAVDEIREPHQATKQGRSTEGWRPGPSGQNRGTEVGRTHDDGDPLRYFALSPLGKLPGSVWTVPTEPLRVPDHLGVDHFAAFPTEWPKRIIQGWSPTGVCVACGEGRRPVSTKEALGIPGRGNEGAGNAYNRESHGLSPVARSEWRKGVTYEVTGYACACTPGSCRECHWLADACRNIRVDTGERCCVACDHEPAPTTPAVVLDPFGGTGTTAMVAKALGRHGISVDMSADYCRLAEWRTNDRGQLAKVLGVAKAEPVAADEQSLLDLLGGETA